MNRILGKKKLSEEAQRAKDVRGWRKQKKLPETTQSQVNLSTALPALEDFRTSLIMPNLSARFSMLREQDDPASKIGKASDDSVLTPRRKSRLHDLDLDFQLGRISDESAEPTPSKAKPTRPGMPDVQQDSFASENSAGASSDIFNDSVLNRPRPLEGNVLFGGRQKGYKLQNSGPSKVNGLGKVTYENTIHTSPYQKHRQFEKDQASLKAPLTANADGPISDNDSISAESAVTAATALSDNSQVASLRTSDDLQMPRKTSASLRSQRSGDSSLPSQAHSTAATSVTSQPAHVPSTQAQCPPSAILKSGAPERSLTKRRLYEQGLDQHMYEQQSSALSRLNSVHRQQTRSKSPPAALNSNAFGSIHDRSLPSSSSSRPQSPNVLFPPNTFGSLRSPGSGGSTPITSHPQSPSFIPHGEHDEFNMLAATVAPGDRGKATAMGAFNKPKQQFDEDQYLQRLQQLQQAQRAPPPVSAPAAHDPETDMIGDDEKPQMGYQAGDDVTNSPSQMSERAFAVFQSAASAMRSVHSSPNLNSSPKLSVHDGSHFQRHEKPQVYAAVDSPQDLHKEYSPSVPVSYRFHMPHVPMAAPEYESHHNQPPAILEIQEEDEEELPSQMIGDRASAFTTDSVVASDPSARGPPQALGGLIHQHLRNSSLQSSIGTRHNRNDSSQSSVYASTTNRHSDLQDAPDTPRQAGTKHTNSNPWDIDDFANEYYYDKRSAKHDSVSREEEQENVPAWQSDMKPQHTRDTSTGTIQEREAFANELAARQKAIQATMKGITEIESRSTSPMPSVSGASKARNLLRNVSSREVLTRQEQHNQQQPIQQQQPKAMKILGLSTTSLVSHAEHESESQSKRSIHTAESKPQDYPTVGRARGDSESSVFVGTRNLHTSSNHLQSRGRASSVASVTGENARVTPTMPHLLNVRLPEHASAQGAARRSPLPMDGTRASPQVTRPNAQGFFDSKPPNGLGGENSAGGSNMLSPLSTRLASSGRSVSGPAMRNSPGASPITPYSATSSGGGTPTNWNSHLHNPSGKTNSSTLKKRNVTKYDISEPVLISSTSNVETIDLPAGASLRNGMPVATTQPPSKARRQRTMRLFHRFGHDGAADSEQSPSANSTPKQPGVPQLLSANGQYSVQTSVSGSPISPMDSSETLCSSQAGSGASSAINSRKPSLQSSHSPSGGAYDEVGSRERTTNHAGLNAQPNAQVFASVATEGNMF